MKFLISAIIALSFQSPTSLAQSIDADRMTRDIEVAENVLATLIKHEMSQQQTFFGLDVKGSYQPGYGVTFRLPADHSMPFVVTFGENEMRRAVIAEGNSFRYSIGSDGNGRRNGAPATEAPQPPDAINLKDISELSADSLRAAYNDRVIQAAKNFILDYGDFISQLGPNEKIVVTNQGDRQHHFYFNTGKRTRISVEGTKADVTAFRQGKLGRDQAIKKLVVVNTESLDTREPDMEMLSSIFTRLYRPDLSKTYFVDGNVYYERLKDFGSIFYMQMVSSVERNMNRFTIPTLQLENLTQAERDKKVAELYPAFERELKQNVLEYGRTIKSLKGDESLIFNISLTRCTGCGIPSTLELGIKSSVLRDFGAGKIDQNTALSKFTIKKGSNQ